MLYPIIQDRKITFAIVGCGRIAENHFKAIQQHSENIELTAICDDNFATLEAKAQAWGATPYGSYDRMLRDADCDIVVLCTPSGLHAQQAIQEACTRLHAEGYDFTFVPLIDMPNAEVLTHLAGCSFVVDEVYSDSLLGCLGLEAAFFGKPVVVGSKPLLQDYFFPEGMPTPPCEVFYDGAPLPAIRRLLDDPLHAQTLGQQAKEFLHSQWSSHNIITQLCHLLHDTVPASHFCHPADIRYFRGWGMSDEEFYTFIHAYVRQYGHEALYINDKAQLVNHLMRWVSQH